MASEICPMMKRGWALVALALPLSLPVGAAQAKVAKQLQVSLVGVIQDVGSYEYSHEANVLIFGSALGQVVTQPAQLSYELKAQVNGLNVQGSASIELHTSDNGGDSRGQAFGRELSLHAKVRISGMVAAESFPLGCTTNCQSAVAGFCTGLAELRMGEDDKGKVLQVPLLLESAFLNPFGGPSSSSQPTRREIRMAG